MSWSLAYNGISCFANLHSQSAKALQPELAPARTQKTFSSQPVCYKKRNIVKKIRPRRDCLGRSRITAFRVLLICIRKPQKHSSLSSLPLERKRRSHRSRFVIKKKHCKKKSGPGAIRTRDLRFRKPLLYPAELRGLISLSVFNRLSTSFILSRKLIFAALYFFYG